MKDIIDRPIGFFDSGIGGVTVLKKCMNLMPEENYVYYADKENAPYGDKSEEDITRLIEKVVKEVFIKKDVKAIVIACNTATSVAIEHLRRNFDIPIIGIEPAIKPAMKDCKENEKVLVLATEATVKSKRFQNRLKEYDESRYITLGCSGLADLIERGESVDITRYLEKKFKKENLENIASIVLGCTHYPLIEDNIKVVLKKNVKFFDGGVGVSKRLKCILEENNIKANKNTLGSLEILNIGDLMYYEKIKKYIGGNVFEEKNCS